MIHCKLDEAKTHHWTLKVLVHQIHHYVDNFYQ